MMRNSIMRMKTVTLLSFIAGCVLSVSAQTGPGTPSPAKTTGPVNAIVFADFQCPYSSQLFFTLERLQRQYAQGLHIIVRQSPQPIHPYAPLAHRAALAAQRQGKFNAMAEILYANQARQGRVDLLHYAEQLHLDMVRFRRDLDSAAIQNELDRDVLESEALGVDRTPTLFIDGFKMSGVQSSETLMAVIDRAGSSRLASTSVAIAAPVTPGPAVDATLRRELLNAPAATRGSADAPVTITEFTDFQCPFCRQATEPMEKLIELRGKQVRWIVHSFPLDFHPDSELANEAALAAGEQGKFWEMHDLLFSHQSALKAKDLRLYAEQLHLDLRAFDDALLTHRFAGRIAADRALGTRAGVSGTPTFFIDGQMLSGARSLPELNQIVDRELASIDPSVVLASTASKTSPLAAAEHLVATPEDLPGVGQRNDRLITVTWFTDVRSPLAASQADLIQDLISRSPASIRVIFKPFPVASREDSRIASAALLAALHQGRPAFWQVYRMIAERRDTLDRTQLLGLATTAHLDINAFAAELDSASQAVTQDLDEAETRGVRGAPVVFLGDRRIDGLQREDAYTTILDRQLDALKPALSASVPAAATLQKP